MVQRLIVKWIIKAIMKAIQKKHDLKKIDAYVNKPNDLDKQIKSLQKTVNKYGEYIEEVEKNIAILKKVAHPKADFVCTDCGTKAKRVKGKLNKIRRNSNGRSA